MGKCGPPVTRCSRAPGIVCATRRDISGVGTDITTNFTGLVVGKTAKDEGIAGPFHLGFSFPFFNGTFSNLYVSPDGFVTFSPFAGDQSTNTALPGSSAPTNLIALCWSDLDLTNAESHVYVAGDARRKPLRQISTAVGDGALAAVSLERYILGAR